MTQSDKPHVIFIDYLTLMQSDVQMKDRRLEVEKISRDLKNHCQRNRLRHYSPISIK
ncbi:prophage L54a, replicative DNA helicase [Staphylococcus gallinarum]|uniref:Prophage L54a, replicative DNA helicase n=1 Tax=Staphylococcus gallinarum TaxID=1293 RepID=A0A380FK15_STAGA|nr:prophage L54a, replicative DNA helicase [Staphylococcus gallinarum]